MSNDPNQPESSLPPCSTSQWQAGENPYAEAQPYQPVYTAQGGYPPPEPTNTAGLVGFILSLTGIACGLMFPVGLIVSLVGLRREPKTFAIAGTVIGAVGTVFITLFVGMYAVMLIAVFSTVIWQAPQFETEGVLADAGSALQDEYDLNGEPNQQTADAVIATELDGWGNPILYEPDGDGGFVLRSAGADGQYKTEDDVTHRETYGERIVQPVPGAWPPAGQKPPLVVPEDATNREGMGGESEYQDEPEEEPDEEQEDSSEEPEYSREAI